jgi:predicted amidohydrolase
LNDLTVSLLQMAATESDAKINITRAREIFHNLTEMPNVLVLPELWPGSRVSRDSALSAREAVSELCAEHGIYAVAGTIPWADERGISNRAWILDDLGRGFAFYDKTHLSSKDGEGLMFVSGNSARVFEACGVTSTVMTSYDALFPEFHRSISLSGAKIFFVVSRWRSDMGGIWESTLRAIAAWNQVFVAACNQTGESASGKFFGNSMVVSPSGDILGRLGDEEGALSITLDLREIKRIRRNLSIEHDRRNDIYTILS